jgi:hypothetical protein
MGLEGIASKQARSAFTARSRPCNASIALFVNEARDRAQRYHQRGDWERCGKANPV